MVDKDTLSGRKIGEFVFRERLDEGGFGTVYRCDQPTLGREAVVKVLHHRLRGHDVQLQRFLREAQLASRLDHPYAAHVYAFGAEEVDGLLWIAMEFVHGITLKRWLRDHGPMPLEQFVPFFEHVAEVVQTAHERGIVHRDLKPSNMMVIERAGRLLPKLLDFGVAKLLDGELLPKSTPDTVKRLRALVVEKVPDEVLREFRAGASTTNSSPTQSGGQSRLTPDNATVGTPEYMAPEQWSSAVTVGPSSDLYALAVVAFEALTGRRPFQGVTMADFVALHCHGDVPALGGSFPPALDQIFQRALAKRPEDRFRTALELAGALRAASGIGATRADLPRIDQDIREAWLADAPQPLAESVAALDGAHNAHQARDAAQELARNLLRYLLALALATGPRAGDDQGDPALLELVRALGKRDLAAEERLQLLRLLVRPHGDHPIPELVDLMTPGPDGTDVLEPILGLYSITDHSGSEDSVRLRMQMRLPVLSQLLHKTTFLLDYVLIVPRGSAAERWTGRRQQHRVLATVLDGELVEGHPMLLDRNGRICADLWPLVQAAPPSDGAEPELFMFHGRGPHGAQLIAAPRSIVRDDSNAWRWVAKHLIAEVEAKARMHDQVRTAARQWQDQARPDGLLWRGAALADLERWTRHTAAAAPLGELETSFIASCRRVARRRRWGRRALIAAGMAAVLGAVEYRAATQMWMAQQETRTAEVEQGRAALLHDDLAEARLHLSEAYRHGDRSAGVEFMLARALQPRLAEQARFASTSGHIWSALFSPDGRQIVTTDDRSAQLWDAMENRLLFTLPHDDIVYHAAYSPDGTRLVTAGGDASVKIWNAASGALVRELTHADSRPTRYFVVGIPPDGKLIAAIDTTGAVARVWDANTGAVLAELGNDGSEYPSLAFSADGRWLATSGGNDVRVFETRTWAKALTIAGPRIRTMSFDPTGPRLVTGTAGGDAAIWAIPSGARIQHLRELGEPVDQVAFSPNGELVVAASRDGAEQVWNAGSGALQSQGNYLRGKIQSIEFDRTSTLMLAAGASGTVVVAEVAQGMSAAVLEGPRAAVRVAHFDPTSRRVVGASLDGTARVWDANPPYRRWSSPPISDDCGLMGGLDPDQRYVVVGCRGHATRVWDTARDQLLAELPSVTPVDGDFTSAFPAVSTEGDRAAIARGNTVVIYELPGGRQLRTIAHATAVNAIAFAGAGHDVVSGAVDGSLLVTRDGRDPLVLPSASRGIDAAAILADGRVVAAAGEQLRVYDPGRDPLLANLAIPTRVGLLRPSPDGRSLITVPIYARRAAQPVLWDIERYRLVTQLKGHVGRVFSVRFVAGGEILSAGIDGTARLWDGATGQLRQTYRGSTRFLADATLSPDGAMVVAGGDDGLLWFWDASNARPLWTLPAHKSPLIGVHFEGDDIVTRGFAGDVSRWTLPKPERVIEACRDHDACGIVPK